MANATVAEVRSGASQSIDQNGYEAAQLSRQEKMLQKTMLDKQKTSAALLNVRAVAYENEEDDLMNQPSSFKGDKAMNNQKVISSDILNS